MQSRRFGTLLQPAIFILSVALLPAQAFAADQTDGQAVTTGEAETAATEATPDTWEKTKAVSAEAWDATKEGSAKAWDKTREVSSEAWDATKEGSAKAWEKTREVSAEAWDATKEGSAKAWEKTKELTQPDAAAETAEETPQADPQQP